MWRFAITPWFGLGVRHLARVTPETQTPQENCWQISWHGFQLIETKLFIKVNIISYTLPSLASHYGRQNDYITMSCLMLWFNQSGYNSFLINRLTSQIFYLSIDISITNLQFITTSLAMCGLVKETVEMSINLRFIFKNPVITAFLINRLIINLICQSID